MPDLPTLTVTSAQMTRIQNAFPGATQAEKADAYRQWLRESLRSYVKMRDQETLRAKFEADVVTAAAAVDTDLSGI